MGDHQVAIEETEGEMVLQWQCWSGHWFCHTCLADYVSDREDAYPEDVQ